MKTLDLLSVGSWASFDHLFFMSKYPEEGETILVHTENGKEKVYFGDCSINLAYVAQTLGAKTGLATIVGDDFYEKNYDDHLKVTGMDLSGVVRRVGKSSGHNYLYFDAHGDGFCFSNLGAGKDQNHERVPEELIQSAKHVVVSEKFSPYTLDAIQKARKYGAKTYINGMIETAGDLLLDFLVACDVLFINESEFKRLLEVTNLSQEEWFHKLTMEYVFITKGKRGSEVITKKGTFSIAPVKGIVAKDTTGAGDSFAAGTITSLMKGFPPQMAAQIGATVSSFVIEKWGCQTNVPTWDEMKKRYQQHYGTLLIK